MIQLDRLFEEVDLGSGEDDNGDLILYDIEATILVDPHDATEWHFDKFVVKYTDPDEVYTSSEIVDIALCWGIEDQKRRLECQDRMRARALQITAAVLKGAVKFELDNEVADRVDEWKQSHGDQY